MDGQIHDRDDDGQIQDRKTDGWVDRRTGGRVGWAHARVCVCTPPVRNNVPALGELSLMYVISSVCSTAVQLLSMAGPAQVHELEGKKKPRELITSASLPSVQHLGCLLLSLSLLSIRKKKKGRRKARATYVPFHRKCSDKCSSFLSF